MAGTLERSHLRKHLALHSHGTHTAAGRIIGRADGVQKGGYDGGINRECAVNIYFRISQIIGTAIISATETLTVPPAPVRSGLGRPPSNQFVAER